MDKGVAPKPDDATTKAANPAHYRAFSNGAQPAFIAEHLTWNSGSAVRYLARGDKKAEIGLTVEQTYMQNLKKALWHVKREILLRGGDPDDVVVPPVIYDDPVYDDAPILADVAEWFRRVENGVGRLHAECGACDYIIVNSEDWKAFADHMQLTDQTLMGLPVTTDDAIPLGAFEVGIQGIASVTYTAEGGVTFYSPQKVK